MTTLIKKLQHSRLQRMYQEQDISYVGLFGSFARGEQRADSDIDLLVNFDSTRSLFDLARVKLFFQDALGRKVDVSLKNHIKKSLQPYIDQDIITVYEKK